MLKAAETLAMNYPVAITYKCGANRAQWDIPDRVFLHSRLHRAKAFDVPALQLYVCSPALLPPNRKMNPLSVSAIRIR